MTDNNIEHIKTTGEETEGKIQDGTIDKQENVEKKKEDR